MLEKQRPEQGALSSLEFSKKGSPGSETLRGKRTTECTGQAQAVAGHCESEAGSI